MIVAYYHIFNDIEHAYCIFIIIDNELRVKIIFVMNYVNEADRVQVNSNSTHSICKYMAEARVQVNFNPTH